MLSELDIDDVPVVNKLPIIIGSILALVIAPALFYLVFLYMDLENIDSCCFGVVILPFISGILFIITGIKKRYYQISGKKPIRKKKGSRSIEETILNCPKCCEEMITTKSQFKCKCGANIKILD